VRIRFLATLVAAVAVLALPQAAAASHGCSKHASGGKVTYKTKESHVFEKHDHWYGCAARVGRPYLLPGLDTITAGRQFGDGTVPSHITLAGVFVAYERYTIYPAGGAGDTQTDLYVVDLRTGKVVVDEEAAVPSGQQEDREVERIVLKRNGSVGWTSGRSLYDRPYPQSHRVVEVHRFSLAPGSQGRADLDSGEDVDPLSLALSADRLTMTWRHGNEQRSAPLP
jgi:hypothetical protein